jgi:hypothetical protein
MLREPLKNSGAPLICVPPRGSATRWMFVASYGRLVPVTLELGKSCKEDHGWFGSLGSERCNV